MSEIQAYPPAGSSFEDWLDEERRNDAGFAEEFQDGYIALHLGNQMALLREDRGLTQRQLAELSGIRQPHLARIERGALPTIPTLRRLLLALKATMHTDAQGLIHLKARAARRRTAALRTAATLPSDTPTTAPV